MANPKISIIIPNLNGADFLAPCLGSLKKQSFSDYELIIIDNASTDNSLVLVKEKFPQSTIFSFTKNEGFAVAVNKGISLAKGEYIFLLNNDTELDVNCLNVLNGFLDSNPEVSFCATKMLYFYDRNIIDIAGDIMTIYGIAHKKGNGEIDKGQYDKSQTIFGACAGAAFYRRSLFEKIGNFDEDFFAYLEDVDFSFRANLLGFKCQYVPGAVVYHVDGGTSRKIKNFTLFLTIRNQLHLIYKNFPLPLIFLLSPFLLIGQIRNFLSGIKNHYLKDVLRAYGDFFGNLKTLKKKRKTIQTSRRANNFQIFNLLSKKYPFSILKK